jgi:N4-(beta-N-acetylglucosaminyl)-L-asparaginase
MTVSNNRSRRKFLQITALGTLLFPLHKAVGAMAPKRMPPKGFLVISTWDAGINANAAAWKSLMAGEGDLTAVEHGVMVTESEINCCVGLGANPDRDGFVTLDASIMDTNGNCGSVAALERIAHPISVARAVMEKTPHVMLVGEGAQQFALEQGFQLEPKKLSPAAELAYKEWLVKSTYHPKINVENGDRGQNHSNTTDNTDKKHGPFAPLRYENGDLNHDTIGMVAIDERGNLAGACTTSGMGFKMRGRVGDSPIIGAGLYVDNEIGAATATGHGEEVIRIAGCHLVVELMRNGLSPMEACRQAVERAVRLRGDQLVDKQIGFIAINKNREHGAFCLRPGFTYAVCSNAINNEIFKAESYYKQ